MSSGGPPAGSVSGGWPPAAAAAAVAAWSVHVPGPGLAAAVPELPGVLAEPPGGACPADQAHTLLGRKGLLNKDPATRLALCAVHRALDLPPGERRPAGPPDPGTAVVASSNLGNLATVTDMVRSVRAGRQREISPLSAPGASSNVLASAVAIWFGFGGPNLMICSGATSGADALGVGLLLLRAGRAARVVVVGAEPADPVAAGVHATRAGPAAPLREGAACVILSPPGTGPAPRLAAVPPGEAGAAGGYDVVLGPGGPAVIDLAPGGPAVIDLAARWGDLYGAMGVVQAAVAAAAVAAGVSAAAAVICGDPCDSWRTFGVRRAAGA